MTGVVNPDNPASPSPLIQGTSEDSPVFVPPSRVFPDGEVTEGVCDAVALVKAGARRQEAGGTGLLFHLGNKITFCGSMILGS